MADEDIDVEPVAERRRRVSRWLIVGLVAAVLIGILLASSVWQGGVPGALEEPKNTAVAEKQVDPEAWCAAQATYDAMRRELFRRAAQVRGSDDQAYTRLADFALLRVNGPIVRGIDDRLDSVSCSGTAVLSLPPGVAVSGGRRSLSADIDYMIQPAADGSGKVVRLGNADSIVVPLATLSRISQAQGTPLFPDQNSAATEEVDADQQAAQNQQQEQQQQQQEDRRVAAAATPSFDCNAAKTGGEVAVCNDPGLAGLDRQMAAQFTRALTHADRSQRKLLERTRDRFLSYRDRCETNQCIAETYRSRMREIADIMADRWRG